MAISISIVTNIYIYIIHWSLLSAKVSDDVQISQTHFSTSCCIFLYFISFVYKNGKNLLFHEMILHFSDIYIPFNCYDNLLGAKVILSGEITCILVIRECEYPQLLDKKISQLPSPFSETNGYHTNSTGYTQC